MANDIKFDISIDASVAKAALTSLSTYLSNTVSSFSKLSSVNPFAGVQSAALATQGALSRMAGTVVSVQGLLGTASAAFALSSFKAATAAETTFLGMQSSAKATGDSFVDLWALVKKYTADGLISESDMADSIRNLRAMGFAIKDVDTLIGMLKDKSAYSQETQYGGDMGAALKALTEGVRGNNSAKSDALKMDKNLSVAQDEYAKSIKTTSTLLTDQDRLESTKKFIYEGVAGSAGDAARKLETAAGATARFETALGKLKVAVGSELAPAFTPFIQDVLIPMTTLLALGVTGLGEMAKSIIDVAKAAKQAKSVGEFTDKLGELDDQRQERMLPKVEAARKAIGLPVAGDPPPAFVDYRGPRMKAMIANTSQADVLAAVGMPGPGLPSLAAPGPGGKLLVDGPTKSTQGTADTADAKKAAETEKKARETNLKQEAVKNLEARKEEIENARAESDNKIGLLKAEIATRAQLRAERLTREKTTEGVAAREASADSLKVLEAEADGRAALIETTNKALQQALIADDPKAIGEYRRQLETQLSLQRQNTEAQVEATSKANTTIFEGENTTQQKIRTLRETNLESTLKTQLSAFEAEQAAELAIVEARHSEKLDSEATYIRKSAELAKAKLDKDTQQAQERLDFLSAQKPTSKQDGADLAAKMAEQRSIVDKNRTELLSIEASTASKIRLNAIELSKLQTDLDAQLAEAEGRSFEAKSARIDAWLAEKRIEFAALPEMMARAEGIASAQKKGNRFDQAQEGIGAINSDFSRKGDDIKRQQSTGQIPDITADLETVKLAKEQVAVLRERLAVLKENANASPAQVEAIKALEGQILDLDATMSTTAQSINGTFFKSLEQGFQDMITGAKTPLEALKGIVASTLSAIASEMLKFALQQALISAMGGASGGAGGGLGGAIVGAIFGGAREKGGDVSSGKAYLIGEKGPEMMFPGVSGRVVSNAEMQKAMGGMMTRQVAAPSSGMSQNREALAPGGTTNVNVRNRVQVSSEQILSAMQELPGFEKVIVQAVSKNGKRVQSAWGN